LLKKAAIYARFSSNNQRQESIFHQVEKIKQYANDNGIELVESYIDEAESGTTDQRTNFLKMINDAPTASWKYIVVYKMDRLSRNVSDALNYKKHLANLGIKIISVIEDFDTDTPEGGLFNLITMGLSQYYVENMKRETMAGILQNAKTGRHSGGRAPLGYKVKNDLHYEIDEVGAKAVRIIFNMIADKRPYTEITRTLKEHGLKTIEGNDFRPNFVDLISNRKYLGEYVYNRTVSKDALGKRRNRLSKPESEIIRLKGAIPQLIDEELFNRAQEAINSRKRGKFNTWAKSKYLLSGRIQCSICGRSVLGNVSFRTDLRAPVIQYRCVTKGVKKCSLKAVNMLNFDNVIIGFLKDVLLEEDNLKTLKKIVNQQSINYIEKQKAVITQLQLRLETLQNNIKTINSSLANSNKAMEKILYSELKESILEKERIESEIETLKTRKQPEAKLSNEIKSLIRPDRRLLKSMEIENHKLVLSKYIKRLRLSNEGVIIHIPLYLFINNINNEATLPLRIRRYFIVNPEKYKLPASLEAYEVFLDELN
jgi:site-specific DNA recombinase